MNIIINNLKTQSIEEIVKYDIKNEWYPELQKTAIESMKKRYGQCIQERKSSLSPWEKMCCYRVKPMKFDCDVSLRNILIYAIAFPCVLKETPIKISLQPKDAYKYRIQCGNKMIAEYRGDTMNSYRYTINEYLRLFGDNKENPEVLKINYVGRNKEKFMTSNRYSEWEECILDNYDYFEEILPAEAMVFIEVNHTIGNFIPVPYKSGDASFNSPRGLGNTKDYWDLALLYIYNWYKVSEGKDANLYLKKIVKTRENCELCKAWLSGFLDEEGKPSWNTFVERNYLEDFVGEKDISGSYGRPIELWDGHFINQGKLPVFKKDFIQFFDRTAKLIMERGKRIAIFIKNKLDDENLISELQCMMEE